MQTTAKASRIHYQAVDVYEALADFFDLSMEEGITISARIANTEVSYIIATESLSSGTGQTTKDYEVGFFKSDGTIIDIKDLGYGYKKTGYYDYSSLRYRYNKTWTKEEIEGAYVTKDMEILIYKGGNKLVVNIPGIDGGGVHDIDSLEKGQVYIAESGYMKVKL